MHHQLGGSTEDEMNKMSFIGHISLNLISQIPMSIWLYNNGQIVVASTGWLLRRILSHRLCLSTCRRLACCLLRHLRLKFANSPSLAPPLSSPPLFAPRPSPASSNAWRTLPMAASPTATVPSCTALVIQHVHLRRHIVIFTAQPSTILAQLSSYLGGR